MTNFQSLNAILPVVVLAVTGMIVLLGDTCLSFWRRSASASGIVSLVGIVVAAFVGLARLGDPMLHFKAFNGALSVGPFTQACTMILLLVAAMAVLVALTYLDNRGLNQGEYYALLLFATCGAILMCAANDLIVLFVAVELLSVALYILTGFAKADKKSQEAALKYFLLGSFAAGFLLYGIALVFGGTSVSGLIGTTNLTTITARIPDTPSFMFMAGLALVLVGLGFKAALAPFHMWAPDVYEGAPTSVTGFMATAVKIGAFAALLRLMSHLGAISQFWLPSLEVIAILTMVVGNLLAVTQTNVKRMLAYSSVAHAGYLLIAVSACANVATRPEALQAGLFYLLAYALMTMGAFAVLVYLSSRNHDCETLQDIAGLVKKEPLAAYLMAVFMLSLGGIPPTMGFVGKWLLFSVAMQAHLTALAVTLALVSMVAVFYYLRVIWSMCFQDPDVNTLGATSVAPAGVQITIVCAAVLSLLLGVIPAIVHPMLLAAQTLVQHL